MSYILVFSRASDTGLQDILIINWETSLGDTALKELQNWLREEVLNTSACTGNYLCITHLWWNNAITASGAEIKFRINTVAEPGFRTGAVWKKWDVVEQQVHCCSLQHHQLQIYTTRNRAAGCAAGREGWRGCWGSKAEQEQKISFCRWGKHHTGPCG